MGFRTYVIRHAVDEAWLIQILADGKVKVYRYMPDVGMAMKFETLTEAKRIAEACRGRVQIFRRSRSGEPYATEVENVSGNNKAGNTAAVPAIHEDAGQSRKRGKKRTDPD